MDVVNIRYIVDEVNATIEFYSVYLDFTVEMNPAPGFAALRRGNLRLFLNAPGAGGAGAAMPDGTRPEPGGWNRFQIQVTDLDAFVAQLKSEGVNFRNEIVEGQGGKQILLEDPSGNLIELFESKR